MKGNLIRVNRISRILCVKDVGIIYLGSSLPTTSSGVPGVFCGTGRSTTPASPCSRWGLPGHRHCCPCRCALTAPFHPHILANAICSLLHLPSGRPARPLTGIVALWSADFPRQERALPRFPLVNPEPSLYRRTAVGLSAPWPWEWQISAIYHFAEHCTGFFTTENTEGTEILSIRLRQAGISSTFASPRGHGEDYTSRAWAPAYPCLTMLYSPGKIT